MSVADRIADAELLWSHGRREGAILNALIAVQATARRAYPDLKDRAAFEKFLRAAHAWTISVEYRGQQVDVDHLFYKWLRCELVHRGSMPIDIRFHDDFPERDGLMIRAGGVPDHVVLLSPGWFFFMVQAVTAATPPP